MDVLHPYTTYGFTSSIRKKEINLLQHQHQLTRKAKKMCISAEKKFNTSNTITSTELLPLSTIAKRPPTIEITPQLKNQTQITQQYSCHFKEK